MRVHYSDFGIAAAPNCGATSPTIVDPIHDGYYLVRWEWPQPCVQPGERVNVYFWYHCPCPATLYTSYEWQGVDAAGPAVGGLVDLPKSGASNSRGWLWLVGMLVALGSAAFVAYRHARA